MKLRLFASTFALIAISHVPPAKAEFIIATSPGLFAPSFRDGTNSDLGNSTWWGWSSGTFGAPSSTVNNPPVNLGIGGLDGAITQTTSNPIVSMSSNIYTGSNFAENIQFTITTNGIVGTGFTTIIVQGRTAFGGFNTGDPGTFGDIAGFSPTVVVGSNSAGQDQFWVKYEILGNAASYTMDYTLNSFTSLAELTVDTQWSATNFAPDVAAVPEPSTLLFIAIAGLAAVTRRRRR